MTPRPANAPTILSVTPRDRLLRESSNDLQREKQRLRKATREFESLFYYEMLKTMRKTIPQDSSANKGTFSNDLGKDTFTQIFDMELARKMARGGSGSISDLLYTTLEKVVEAQYRTPTSDDNKIESLQHRERQPIELERHRPATPLNRSTPIPIDSRNARPALVPLTTGNRSGDHILQRFGRHIEDAARQTALDAALIYAVIKAESDGNPRAVSPRGAKGLMQLVDATARDLRVKNVFDPRENILAGSRYLASLVRRFGDLRLALAAYNAGPQQVERFGGVPPFAETRAYIDKVIDLFTSFSGRLSFR
jgi:Rod binding domain-containing protein